MVLFSLNHQIYQDKKKARKAAEKREKHKVKLHSTNPIKDQWLLNDNTRTYRHKDKMHLTLTFK